MKRILLLPPVLAAAACATSTTPYSPVENPVYQALGSEPFWSLAIGDDRIVLWNGAESGDAVWPRVPSRLVGDVTSWEARNGDRTISIEARPGPCETEGQEIFEDHVRVRVDDIVLTGCGGRLIGQGAN